MITIATILLFIASAWKNEISSIFVQLASSSHLIRHLKVFQNMSGAEKIRCAVSYFSPLPESRIMSSLRHCVEKITRMTFPNLTVLHRQLFEGAEGIRLGSASGVDLVVVPSGSPASRAIAALAGLGIPVAYAYGTDERTDAGRALAVSLAKGSKVCLLDEGHTLEIMGVEFCGVPENCLGKRSPLPGQGAVEAMRVFDKFQRPPSPADSNSLSATDVVSTRESVDSPLPPGWNAEEEGPYAKVYVGEEPSRGNKDLDLATRLQQSLSEIGQNLKSKRPGKDSAATKTNYPVATSAPWMHISSDDVRFPMDEACHPLSASMERNFLAHCVLSSKAESVSTALRGISMATAFMAVSKSTPLTDRVDENGDQVWLSHDIAEWGKGIWATSELLSGESRKFAVASFPLVHLNGAKTIAIGVYIQETRTEREKKTARQTEKRIRDELNSLVERGFDSSIRFDVIVVESLNDLRRWVPTVSHDFIESLCAVVAHETL